MRADAIRGSAGEPGYVIERSVQARAKELDLEMGPAGVGELRALVADAAAEWERGFEHDRRPFPLPDPQARHP